MCIEKIDSAVAICQNFVTGGETNNNHDDKFYKHISYFWCYD